MAESKEAKSVKVEKDAVPMERQSFGKIFKDIPRRLLSVIWQMIGSRKTYVMVATALLILFGAIPEAAVGYVWLVSALIYLFGIEGLKWLKDIKK